jgi:hypothetical protein
VDLREIIATIRISGDLSLTETWHDLHRAEIRGRIYTSAVPHKVSSSRRETVAGDSDRGKSSRLPSPAPRQGRLSAETSADGRARHAAAFFVEVDPPDFTVSEITSTRAVLAFHTDIY